MMRSKEKSNTGFNKRSTTYEKKVNYADNNDKAADPLKLPPEF